MVKRYQCKACGHCCILELEDNVNDKPFECPFLATYYTAWNLFKRGD